MSSQEFSDVISRELDTFQPDIVRLDPFYNYAPKGIETSNLVNVGAGLDALRNLVGETTLVLVNHYNQTGQGMSLTRITGAGHAEWADSWWLLDHRAQGDVTNGKFSLKLEIGSRQWGGGSFHIDLNIGRFDELMNEHVGAVSWTVRSAIDAPAEEQEDMKLVDAQLAIMRAWRKRRGPHHHEPWLRTDWLARVQGIKAETKRAAFSIMVDEGKVIPRIVETVDASNRKTTREAFSLHPDWDQAG
jgi:hypothetical protein